MNNERDFFFAARQNKDSLESEPFSAKEQREMRKTAYAFRNSYFKDFNSTQTVEVFNNFRNHITQNGQQFSRPNLGYQFVEYDLGKELEEITFYFLECDDALNFSLFYDLRHILKRTLGIIPLAEEAIRGDTERILQIATDITGYTSESFRPDETSLDIRLQTFLAAQREAKEASELLKQDKTAFLLLDNFLQRVQEDPVMSGYLPFFATNIQKRNKETEISVFGAKFAVDAYKRIYPLTE